MPYQTKHQKSPQKVLLLFSSMRFYQAQKSLDASCLINLWETHNNSKGGTLIGQELLMMTKRYVPTSYLQCPNKLIFSMSYWVPSSRDSLLLTVKYFSATKKRRCPVFWQQSINLLHISICPVWAWRKKLSPLRHSDLPSIRLKILKPTAIL